MDDLWTNISYSVNLLPSPEMSDGERLNCLTRFVILVSFLLYVFIPTKDHWLYFLGVSMTCVLFVWYTYPYTCTDAKAPEKN